MAERLRGRRHLAGRYAAVLLCVLVGFVPSADAGDADLAGFLLKHGQTALSNGEYDDALTKLRKAREEDPTLIEATYVIAVVYERKKDVPKAVVEYRAFQRLAEDAERNQSLSNALGKLYKKTLSRLKSLDAGNLEIDKVQRAFADDLYLSARAMVGSDFYLAMRMLKVALKAVPDHNDAENLLAELLTGANPLPPAFDAVHEWRDAIATSFFGAYDGWTYKDDKISVSQLGGSISRPPGSYDAGTAYAFSADMTLTEIPTEKKTMTVGLLFGLTSTDGFGAQIMHDAGKEDRVVLSAISLNPAKDRPLKVKAIPGWEDGKGYRLSVLVEGTKVTIFVNNQVAIEQKVPGRDDLSGDFGIALQNVKLTFNRLRVGKIPGGAK